MAAIPQIWVIVSFIFVFCLSLYFYYRYYKKRRTTHFWFGLMCLLWAFVALFSLIIENSITQQSSTTLVYFKLYLSSAILAYPVINLFATSFLEEKVFALRRLALILGTILILSLVWFSPLHPNETGDDFAFESIFIEPKGLPIFELMTVYLLLVTLGFLLRMFSHTHYLWNESKPLAIKTFLLGISTATLFFIFTFEITTYTFPTSLYMPVMGLSAAGMLLAFISPESLIRKVIA